MTPSSSPQVGGDAISGGKAAISGGKAAIFGSTSDLIEVPVIIVTAVFVIFQARMYRRASPIRRQTGKGSSGELEDPHPPH